MIMKQLRQCIGVFFFACTIAQIQTKGVFLSKQTLLEGEALNVECSISVLRQSIPYVRCVNSVGISQFNVSAQKYEVIAELYYNDSPKNYGKKPWWNISMQDLKYSDIDCINPETGYIKAFIKAVRVEDSGLYCCFVGIKKLITGRPNRTSVNEIVVVIPRQGNHPLEESTEAMQMTVLHVNATGDLETRIPTTMKSNTGTMATFKEWNNVSTTIESESGVRDPFREGKNALLLTTLVLMWRLVVNMY